MVAVEVAPNQAVIAEVVPMLVEVGEEAMEVDFDTNSQASASIDSVVVVDIGEAVEVEEVAHIEAEEVAVQAIANLCHNYYKTSHLQLTARRTWGMELSVAYVSNIVPAV